MNVGSVDVSVGRRIVGVLPTPPLAWLPIPTLIQELEPHIPVRTVYSQQTQTGFTQTEHASALGACSYPISNETSKNQIRVD